MYKFTNNLKQVKFKLNIRETTIFFFFTKSSIIFNLLLYQINFIIICRLNYKVKINKPKLILTYLRFFATNSVN